MAVGLVILLVLLALIFLAANKLYNIALNPKADRRAVFSNPINTEDVSGKADEGQAEIDRWWENSGYGEEYIKSSDGLKLHAFILEQPKPGKLWVICVHGYTGNAVQMTNFAKRFWDRGYSLLMPNLRGHGKSEGSYIGMGWHDRKDIKLWVDHILYRQADAQVVLFGISMGAATVMMTAGEELPKNVIAAVEDCGYSCVWDEFAYQMKQLFRLPAFPLLHAANLISAWRAGYSLKQANAVRQLEKTRLPILFIHGEEDTFVPFFMLDKVYEASPAQKARYTVPGAGHGQASYVAGDMYWTKVFSFLSQYEAG